MGELVAKDAFLYAGTTRAVPPDPSALQRIAGVGSSPTVSYEGQGTYFLDKVRPGLWRLEVYPDAVPVRDPFEPPNLDKIVTRAIGRAWPMTIALPDLGRSFTVQPITAGNPESSRAAAGRFTVTPGVYVLSAAGPVDVATLPASVGAIRFAEYHAPPPDSLSPAVQSLAAPEYLAGRPASLRVRVVDRTPPDSVKLFIRPVAGGLYRGFVMTPVAGYEYAVSLPGTAFAQGPYQFVITLFRGDSVGTFPGGVRGRPTEWDYHNDASWKLRVVGSETPLRLFEPGQDATRLAFTQFLREGRSLPSLTT